MCIKDSTKAAKIKLKSFIESCDGDNVVLGIMKWRAEGEPEEHWGYGAYSREQVDSVAGEIEPLGYSVLYELDGLTVAFDQNDLLSELEGCVIDVDGERLIVKK